MPMAQAVVVVATHPQHKIELTEGDIVLGVKRFFFDVRSSAEVEKRSAARQIERQQTRIKVGVHLLAGSSAGRIEDCGIHNGHARWSTADGVEIRVGQSRLKVLR